MVGQQVTLTSTNAATEGPRIDQLIARAAAGDCDLTVKGIRSGIARGWYRTAAGVFQSDRAGEAAQTDGSLRAEASITGQERTYTCVPPGSGIRIGVDRDEDGTFDRDEIDQGTDPADPSSVSPPPPTPTPTASSTATSTRTPTVTPTRTATPGCGDGNVNPGEECDDGNHLNGDGCSATCQSELIPGGGLARSDCTHEWLTQPMPADRDNKGLPKHRLECTNDDPTCDFGVAGGDATCTFHVALCFNAIERRLSCAPIDVAQIKLQRPSATKPANAVDMANRDALEGVLTGLGGTVTAQCMRPLSQAGLPCTTDSQCDVPAGSGNGECRGRLVLFAPSLTLANRCSGFASITVPLRSGRRGMKVLRLSARPSNDPFSGAKRPRDTDTLTLVCNP